MGSQKKTTSRSKKSIAKTKAVSKRSRTRFQTIEYDGDKYKVAVIEKGNDVSKDHKIEIMKVAFLMYSTDLYSIDECLKYVGVKSDATFYKWLDEIEEIEVMYNESKIQKDRRYKRRLKERARTKLEEAIEGKVVNLTETKYEFIPVTDEKGKVISANRQPVEMKEKQIYVRPSVPAILAVIYNVDGQIIQQRPEPYQAGNEQLPTDIKVEIVGGLIDPVTSEEDIVKDLKKEDYES